MREIYRFSMRYYRNLAPPLAPRDLALFRTKVSVARTELCVVCCTSRTRPRLWYIVDCGLNRSGRMERRSDPDGGERVHSNRDVIDRQQARYTYITV